jgi:dGTPase
MRAISREPSMAESMRLRLERAEDERLAPWALRSAGASRRYAIEDEGRAFDYRTEFQRDRDRIVYSRAFRRLRQKAPAGFLPAYEDHRRNRLTHTLEVAQVARTIGRALLLNEDLVEAVALGHDLGQPAFGAAGEAALDDLLSGRLDGKGGPGLGDLGGFSSAWQALRVVDRIEKRYDHPGLNLTDDAREGIVKAGRPGRGPAERIAGFRADRPPSLEAQVVALSDRIASAVADLDDAIQGGALPIEAVEKIRAVKELARKLGRKYPAGAGKFRKANAIHRGLTHLFVTGAIFTSVEILAAWGKESRIEPGKSARARRDRALADGLVALSAPGEKLLEDLEGVLVSRVHRAGEAARADAWGRRVLLGLFAAYQADPALLEDHVLLRFKEEGGVRYLRDLPPGKTEEEVRRKYRSSPVFARILADYLAGMTDAFALQRHGDLLKMGAVPIPSAEQLRREERGRRAT